jgi:hypothetical protein
MTALVATDVTYSIKSQHRMVGIGNRNVVQLSFGDGALTYPANGIPLTKGKMGCPVNIESLVVVDQGTSGYKFQYDQSAEKLVIIQSPAQNHDHDLKIIGGQAAASTSATAYYATDIFGKEAATDATIAGADSATKGGVVSATLAAAEMTEITGIAIAAQVIEVEVIGY